MKKSSSIISIFMLMLFITLCSRSGYAKGGMSGATSDIEMRGIGIHKLGTSKYTANFLIKNGKNSSLKLGPDNNYIFILDGVLAKNTKIKYSDNCKDGILPIGECEVTIAADIDNSDASISASSYELVVPYENEDNYPVSKSFYGSLKSSMQKLVVTKLAGNNIINIKNIAKNPVTITLSPRARCISFNENSFAKNIKLKADESRDVSFHRSIDAIDKLDCEEDIVISYKSVDGSDKGELLARIKVPYEKTLWERYYGAAYAAGGILTISGVIAGVKAWFNRPNAVNELPENNNNAELPKIDKEKKDEQIEDESKNDDDDDDDDASNKKNTHSTILDLGHNSPGNRAGQHMMVVPGVFSSNGLLDAVISTTPSRISNLFRWNSPSPSTVNKKEGNQQPEEKLLPIQLPSQPQLQPLPQIASTTVKVGDDERLRQQSQQMALTTPPVALQQPQATTPMTSAANADIQLPPELQKLLDEIKKNGIKIPGAVQTEEEARSIDELTWQVTRFLNRVGTDYADGMINAYGDRGPRMWMGEEIGLIIERLRLLNVVVVIYHDVEVDGEIRRMAFRIHTPMNYHMERNTDSENAHEVSEPDNNPHLIRVNLFYNGDVHNNMGDHYQVYEPTSGRGKEITDDIRGGNLGAIPAEIITDHEDTSGITNVLGDGNCALRALLLAVAMRQGNDQYIDNSSATLFIISAIRKRVAEYYRTPVMTRNIRAQIFEPVFTATDITTLLEAINSIPHETTNLRGRALALAIQLQQFEDVREALQMHRDNGGQLEGEEFIRNYLGSEENVDWLLSPHNDTKKKPVRRSESGVSKKAKEEFNKLRNKILEAIKRALPKKEELKEDTDKVVQEHADRVSEVGSSPEDRVWANDNNYPAIASHIKKNIHVYEERENGDRQRLNMSDDDKYQETINLLFVNRNHYQVFSPRLDNKMECSEKSKQGKDRESVYKKVDGDVVDVAPDGNCFYHAILKAVNGDQYDASGTNDSNREQIAELRKVVADDILKQHKNNEANLLIEDIRDDNESSDVIVITDPSKQKTSLTSPPITLVNNLFLKRNREGYPSAPGSNLKIGDDILYSSGSVSELSSGEESSGEQDKKRYKKDKKLIRELKGLREETRGLRGDIKGFMEQLLKRPKSPSVIDEDVNEEKQKRVEKNTPVSKESKEKTATTKKTQVKKVGFTESIEYDPTPNKNIDMIKKLRETAIRSTAIKKAARTASNNKDTTSIPLFLNDENEADNEGESVQEKENSQPGSPISQEKKDASPVTTSTFKKPDESPTTLVTERINYTSSSKDAMRPEIQLVNPYDENKLSEDIVVPRKNFSIESKHTDRPSRRSGSKSPSKIPMTGEMPPSTPLSSSYPMGVESIFVSEKVADATEKQEPAGGKRKRVEKIPEEVVASSQSSGSEASSSSVSNSDDGQLTKEPKKPRKEEKKKQGKKKIVDDQSMGGETMASSNQVSSSTASSSSVIPEEAVVVPQHAAVTSSVTSASSTVVVPAPEQAATVSIAPAILQNAVNSAFGRAFNGRSTVRTVVNIVEIDRLNQILSQYGLNYTAGENCFRDKDNKEITWKEAMTNLPIKK